jgi:hypothetical protein
MRTPTWTELYAIRRGRIGFHLTTMYAAEGDPDAAAYLENWKIRISAKRAADAAKQRIAYHAKKAQREAHE